MKYTEVKIHMPRNMIEKVSGALDAVGIDCIAVNDPADLDDIIENKEKYKYDYIADDLKRSYEVSGSGDPDARPAVISFFLEDGDTGTAGLEKVEALIATLNRELTDAGREADAEERSAGSVLEIEHSIVDDEDWKNKWKEFFKPAKITDSITVCPTWEEYESASDETVIRIDPGMAFGTGTHETTSSCIILMEKYLKPEFKVLDVGCGSGILAIAAAFMGCSEVMGVDLDPDAIVAAKENVKINSVEERVEILKGDLAEGLDIKADMVAANLTVNLIERLLADISAHMTADGMFIASGILTEQEQQAKDAMKAQGLEIVETLIRGDWCTIAAKRRAE